MSPQTSRFSTSRTQPPADSTLVMNAALGALAAAATALGLCLAVAIVGWFFADSGGHGSTLDALQVGAVSWVLGLGGSANTAIGHVGLTPLGLTAIEVIAVLRCATWAWRRAAPSGSLTPRLLLTAWATAVMTYLLATVAIVALASSSSVSPSFPGACAGALLIAAGPTAWVGLRESGLLADTWERLPLLAQVTIRSGVQTLFALVAFAAAMVALSLILSFDDARNVYDALHLGFGDALMLTLVCALTLPNMVGLGLAYLAGPGFAVGTLTSVNATSVSLGALPLVPTVAALPDNGDQPWWCVLLLFVPALCALVVAARAQRDFSDVDEGWDQPAIRGLVGGAAAGLVVAIFAGLSGGALGDHRMAEIGPDFWLTLVCAVGGVGLGGVLGGAGMAAWQRWRH